MQYDVLIVGSGTAAQSAALPLAAAGKKVAMVAREPVGGTCALTGCQPKKYLAAHGRLRHGLERLRGKGIAGSVDTDWPALRALKEGFTGRVPERTAAGMEKAGIRLFTGNAVMTGPASLEVEGAGILEAETLVLATGSIPRRGEYPGAELLGDSDDFLAMEALPSSLLFVGGGYIGLEFAHMAAAMGCRVTVLHRSGRPLKMMEEELVRRMMAASEAAGIDLVVNQTADRVEKGEEGIVVYGGNGSVYRAERGFETTGRVADLSVLEGGKGKVETEKGRIKVDGFMRSVSNPRVYAVGDAASTPYQLATTGDEEGRIAAENILHGDREELDLSVVPTAVFTNPTLAMVGLTEEKAEEQGLKYRVKEGETASWPSSLRIGEEAGYYKSLVEETTGRILGFHLLRHNAEEAVNLVALAIRTGVAAESLKRMIWAYPTSTSDVKYML